MEGTPVFEAFIVDEQEQEQGLVHKFSHFRFTGFTSCVFTSAVL